MTDDLSEAAGEAAADRPPEAAPGHPVVTGVLASLRGLDDRPLAEHVEVFGAAHEQLRQLLTRPGDPVTDPPTDRVGATGAGPAAP